MDLAELLGYTKETVPDDDLDRMTRAELIADLVVRLARLGLKVVGTS